MASCSSSLRILVLAATLLGWVSAKCAPAEECEAIRKTVVGFVENNPDYQNLGAPQCQADTRDWIVGAIDLLPFIDDNLGRALLRLAVPKDGLVVMNGGEMLAALAKPEVKTTLRWCQPLCRLAKSGCGCNPNIDVGTSNLVGGDPDIGMRVVIEAVKKCKEDHAGILNFEHRIIRDGSCDRVTAEETLEWSCG